MSLRSRSDANRGVVCHIHIDQKVYRRQATCAPVDEQQLAERCARCPTWNAFCSRRCQDSGLGLQLGSSRRFLAPLKMFCANEHVSWLEVMHVVQDEAKSSVCSAADPAPCPLTCPFSTF